LKNASRSVNPSFTRPIRQLAASSEEARGGAGAISITSRRENDIFARRWNVVAVSAFSK